MTLYEVWVTQEDDSVCTVCSGYDGLTYPVGVGPQPPLHYGCRCYRALIQGEITPEPTPVPQPEPIPNDPIEQTEPEPEPLPAPLPEPTSTPPIRRR